MALKIWGRGLGSTKIVLGLTLLFVLLAASLFAGYLAPYLPTEMQIRNRFMPPSSEHWMGTDAFGRDVLSRVMHGGMVSMTIAVQVVLITGVLGALLGIAAAYFRAAEIVIMRIMDAFMAFPEILLAIAIAAVLGPQIHSVVIAIAVAYIPRTVRLVAGTALVIREMGYVEAATINGASTLRIMVVHLLLNCAGPLVVQLAFVFAQAILTEAALSFIGVGPPPPAPSWGNIINDGRDYMLEAWWISVFPGLAITSAALGAYLLGDGLTQKLDPTLGPGRQ